MRNTIFMLLASAFLTSCGIRAENSVQNSEKAIQINETIQAQPAISPAAPVIANVTFGSKVGAVEGFEKDSGEKFICLTTQNSSLKSGDNIQIILTKTPQQILQAVVSEKLQKRCSSVEKIGNSSEISSYSLKLPDADKPKCFFGIAVVNSTNQVKIDKGLAHVDIDGDKIDEYFRECYGSESLHLFVWKGKPSVGKRIWYSYYYFQYETPPSCKDKELAGVEQ